MNDISKTIVGGAIRNLALFALVAAFLGAAKGAEYGWALIGIAFIVHLGLAIPTYWVMHWRTECEDRYWAKVRERRAQRCEVMKQGLPVA